MPQPEGLTLDVFASNVLTVSWLSPSNSGVSYDYVVSCLEVGEDDATVASELTTNLHHTFTNNIALDRKYIVKVYIHKKYNKQFTDYCDHKKSIAWTNKKNKI